MNVVKEIQRINENEIQKGINESGSWHQQYAHSAYVFTGGLPFDLNEGDIIAIFSQYGEIVDVNLVRDKKTGKSRGFAFIAYEDQRSTILAVDNFNGTKIMGRTLRVDHVSKYKTPTKGEDEETDEELEELKKKAFPLQYEALDVAKGIRPTRNEESEEEPMNLDEEDPMRDYILKLNREKKEMKKKKKEEKKAKKEKGELNDEEKREKKEKKKKKKELEEKEKEKDKKDKSEEKEDRDRLKDGDRNGRFIDRNEREKSRDKSRERERDRDRRDRSRERGRDRSKDRDRRSRDRNRRDRSRGSSRERR